MKDLYYSPRHEERVQVMARRNSPSWLNQNATLLTILITMLVVWAIAGIAAFKVLETTPDQTPTDSTDQLQQKMIQTCQQSYKVINHSMENACGNLIDQVQADNHHEVLNDGKGTFWVETN